MQVKAPLGFSGAVKFTRLSSLHFTGSEAGSTNVHLMSSSVDFYGYMLDVGLPHSVASSMRMAHIVSEMSSFITNSTSSHVKHLLDLKLDRSVLKGL